MGPRASKVLFSKQSGILTEGDIDAVLHGFEPETCFREGAPPDEVAQVISQVRAILGADKDGIELRRRKRELRDRDDELRESELELEDALDDRNRVLDDKLQGAELEEREEKRALEALLRREDEPSVAEVETQHRQHQAALDRIASLKKARQEAKDKFTQAMKELADERDTLERNLSEFMDSIAKKGESEGGPEVWLRRPLGFAKTLPEGFGILTNITHMDLSSNGLTYVHPAFGELRQLTYLSLQGNRLRALPDTFGRLRNLEVCYLHDNMIYFIPHNFGELTKLQSCHIHGNPLSDLPHGAPREDGVLLRDFLAECLRLLRQAQGFHELVVDVPEAERNETICTGTLVPESGPFHSAAPFFFANQHRLESITGDGSALINPRLFWCGWTKKVLCLSAMEGPRSLLDVILHWRNPTVLFKYPEVERAIEMLTEVVKRGDMYFEYPHDRQKMDQWYDDRKVYERCLKENQASQCDLSQYKSSRAALEDGSLERAIEEAVGHPVALDSIVLQGSSEPVSDLCPHCRYISGVYTKWRPGDEALEQGEFETCPSSSSFEVHMRMGMLLARGGASSAASHPTDPAE